MQLKYQFIIWVTWVKEWYHFRKVNDIRHLSGSVTSQWRSNNHPQLEKKKGCSLVIYSPWSVILLYLSTVWLAVILTDILYKGTLLKWIYHKCGFLQDKGKRSKLRNHMLKQNELHRPLCHFCVTCNVDPVFRVLLVGPREYASMHWHQVACIY